MALLLTDAPVERAREPGGGGQQKLVRDLWKEGHQRQLQLCHATTVSGPGVGARWLLPTESVSRVGVWDWLHLGVRSAALEPRAGTRRRARPRWRRSPRVGDGIVLVAVSAFGGKADMAP